ncbi:protein of unknown function (plasmid) [Rhodovastum atsumiense]|nr:protein of unknown function [Rhodovastum atsumiense]
MPRNGGADDAGQRQRCAAAGARAAAPAVADNAALARLPLAVFDRARRLPARERGGAARISAGRRGGAPRTALEEWLKCVLLA